MVDRARPGSRLDDRETTVLRLVAEGHTNAEIGRALLLNEDTVKTLLKVMYKRLGARNRPHAVTLGFQRGLLAASMFPPIKDGAR